MDLVPCLEKPELVSVSADGRFKVALDNFRDNIVRNTGGPCQLPAGEHMLYVMVVNLHGLLAIFAQAETLNTLEAMSPFDNEE